jgi:hypothetical protein
VPKNLQVTSCTELYKYTLVQKFEQVFVFEFAACFLEPVFVPIVFSTLLFVVGCNVFQLAVFVYCGNSAGRVN